MKIDLISDEEKIEIIKLANFFKDKTRLNAIAKLTGASGCREGWIHGELFLAGYSVNDAKLARSHTADFCMPKSPVEDKRNYCNKKLVGEIKLYSTCGFQKKGLKIEHFIQRELSDKSQITIGLDGDDEKETINNREVWKFAGEWGPIRDYYRLRQACEIEPENPLRLFILIIVNEDNNSNKPNEFGKFLNKITFNNAIDLGDLLLDEREPAKWENRLESDHPPKVQVRAWKVLPMVAI